MKKQLLLIALALSTAFSATAQEKVLNLYSARHYQTDEKLYENFTKQTGIKINRIEGKEEELMERIRNEGANSPADVFITVDASRLATADALVSATSVL
jgi:iron(III) transport system substrate-binding protein